jgi:hypothetical protein
MPRVLPTVTISHHTLSVGTIPWILPARCTAPRSYHQQIVASTTLALLISTTRSLESLIYDLAMLGDLALSTHSSIAPDAHPRQSLYKPLSIMLCMSPVFDVTVIHSNQSPLPIMCITLYICAFVNSDYNKMSRFILNARRAHPKQPLFVDAVHLYSAISNYLYRYPSTSSTVTLSPSPVLSHVLLFLFPMSTL